MTWIWIRIKIKWILSTAGREGGFVEKPDNNLKHLVSNIMAFIMAKCIKLQIHCAKYMLMYIFSIKYKYIKDCNSLMLRY